MKKIIFVLILALSSMFWMALTESDYKKDFYFPSKPCVLVYQLISWRTAGKMVDNPFYIDPQTNMPKQGEQKQIMQIDSQYWDTSYCHYEMKKILDTDSGLYYMTFFSNQKKEFRKKDLLTGPDVPVKAYTKKGYASCPYLPNKLIYPMNPVKDMKMMEIDTIHTVKIEGYPSSSTGMTTKKRTYEGSEIIEVDGTKYTCYHFFEKYQEFGKIGIVKMGGPSSKHDIWIAQGIGLVRMETYDFEEYSKSVYGKGYKPSSRNGKPNVLRLYKVYY